MAFDLKAFEGAVIVPRTSAVEVPGLVDWFEATETQRAEIERLTGRERDRYIVEEIGAKWTVRGLSDDEFEAAQKNANGNRAKLAEIFTELAQLGPEDDEGIKERLGADENVNIQTALIAEHILIGSVEPKINIRTAYKLGKNFPIEFRQIATKILELSGLGGIDEKKLNPSGETPQ